MRVHRLRMIGLFAVLLLSNWSFILLFQNGGISTAWAKLLNAPQFAVTIPATFSYQGILRDSKGDLINGAKTINLKLYDSVTGGNILHQETFTDVIVRNGLFNLVVGDNTALDPSIFTNGVIYLGIQVDSDPELEPRQRLHAVPWAIYASSATTATTALNLEEGGGVPTSLNFSTNGGSILDSANGMTLNGGGNGTLTVGGDLVVDGDWSVSAIRDLGDSNTLTPTTSSYPISLKRYVVEAVDKGTAPTSVIVSDTILTDFCADFDGCSLTLGMRNYDDNIYGKNTDGVVIDGGVLATLGPFHLSIGNLVGGKRYWDMRFEGGNTISTSWDGDNVKHEMLNAWKSCYLLDYAHINGVEQKDDAPGIYLNNWFGPEAFNSTQMVCVLIVQD